MSMEKVRVLDAIAVPLLMANVNTDVIIRIERMSLYPRGELGPWALETLRLDAEGREHNGIEGVARVLFNLDEFINRE